MSKPQAFDPIVARWQQVDVQYPQAPDPALRGVELSLAAGELLLVLGRTGSGKTTLLRTANGAVPHSTGGTLTGRVQVVGRDTRTHRPRDLADVVAVVPQRPADAFVADTVEAELAYGMQCLGLAPATMRRRVEETLDLLGLVDLRARALTQLSAGQQQRVALAAAMVMHPALLVLDEPTSALDPTAAEDILAAVHRLVHDLGTTVLLSEHRLERVVQFADRAALMQAGRPPRVGALAEVLADPAVDLQTPLFSLARLLGWTPVPWSIRDARRAALADPRLIELRSPPPPAVGGEVVAECVGLVARHGPVEALRGLRAQFRARQVTAVMGRNGAGKTTLLDCLAGLHRPVSGQVRVAGQDPARLSRRQAAALIALVPADPGDLLLTDRVDRELAAADAQAQVRPGTSSAIADRLLPGLPRGAHPRYLSCGQRLALALATCLARRPALLLLDEPTRGLDYPAKGQAATILRELAAAGHTVVIVTHDVELAAEVADQVVVLAEGEAVSAGPAESELTGSPSFAPQVAKVMSAVGGRFLTVAQVSAALSGDAA